MAKIIRAGAGPEQTFHAYAENHKRQARLGYIFIGVGIAGFAIGVLLAQLLLLFVGIPLAIVGCILLGVESSRRRQMDVLRAGMDGEAETSGYIRALPDTYTGIQNLTVSYQGKSSEIDMLVVGPTGVFVIETKNISGHIYGSIHDTDWGRTKISRGGKAYSKSFYNPVKQVNTHVFRCARYLKEKGCSAYIHAIVYFPNENTTLSVTDRNDATKIFCQSDDGANKLVQYILNGNPCLSQRECERIIAVLTNA